VLLNAGGKARLGQAGAVAPVSCGVGRRQAGPGLWRSPEREGRLQTYWPPGRLCPRAPLSRQGRGAPLHSRGCFHPQSGSRASNEREQDWSSDQEAARSVPGQTDRDPSQISFLKELCRGNGESWAEAMGQTPGSHSLEQQDPKCSHLPSVNKKMNNKLISGNHLRAQETSSCLEGTNRNEKGA